MRPINGFAGKYSITKDGRVWGHRYKHFLKLRGSGYIGKKKRHKRKYKTVVFWEKEIGYRYFYVHRLVAQAYIPNPENLPVINHKNGDPSDNRVENLEWCTNKQNLQHAFLNGLTTRGQKNSQNILTPEQVKEIRTRYFSTKKSRFIKRQEILSKEFGVCVGTIQSIVQGRNWKWLK